MGRGPVCGIIMRRGATAGVSATGGGSTAAGAAGVAGAAGFATAGAAAAATGGATAGFATAGAGVAAAFTTTVPRGGLLAMAGGGAGAIICAAARVVCGMIFLGAGAAGGSALVFVTMVGGAAAAAMLGATLGLATAGADDLAFSACFRSRIAFSASPGLETWDRSNFGADGAALDVAGRLSPRMCRRTFSASSASIELEWVFFSATPTAVSASRIVLLFTSSSRARSLIRTLLIRPLVPLAP